MKGHEHLTPCSQHPGLALSSSEVAVGIFFWTFCPEFTPTAHACSYFFFLHILLLEEMGVQVQGL